MHPFLQVGQASNCEIQMQGLPPQHLYIYNITQTTQQNWPLVKQGDLKSQVIEWAVTPEFSAKFKFDRCW